MQMSDINGIEVSRFGLGTKRFPTEDSSRVIHLDTKAAGEIFDLCVSRGVNVFNTSYSNHKGEAESFLGDEISKSGKDLHVCTSYFEMIDPRYEYVFQKQLKKLQTETIDFYMIEGVTNMNKEVAIDTGVVDFLFERKEQGEIAQVGFSSELKAGLLEEHLKRYPWDFICMKINYYDWFQKGVKDAYEVAAAADVPIIVHGALRTGAAQRLKDEAVAIMREADSEMSSIEWALRFVKSLPNARCITTNVYSTEQVEEDIRVFEDDEVLDSNGFDVLKAVSEAQKTRK